MSDYTEQPVRTSGGVAMLAPRDREIAAEHGLTQGGGINVVKCLAAYRREIESATRAKVLAAFDQLAAAWTIETDEEHWEDSPITGEALEQLQSVINGPRNAEGGR